MNNKIIFTFPDEETSVVEIILRILKDNKLEENDEEYVDKVTKGIETRLIIIRDTIRVLVEKKIPERKIAELLTEHLQTSPEIAGKIIVEIKEKLVPFARIASETPKETLDETETQPITKLAPTPVISKNLASPKLPAIPKPATVSSTPTPSATPKLQEKPVEKPTEKIQEQPEEQKRVKTVIPPEVNKPKPGDTYREPIE